MPITVNLLPNKIYPKLKRDYLIQNSSVRLGHFSKNCHPATVKDLLYEVGIAIFTPDNKYVAVSSPEKDITPSIVADTVSEKIDELRRTAKCKDEEVSAVVYGGVAYDSNTPFSEESCRLADALVEGCESENIEPTVLTGQYCNGKPKKLNVYVGPQHITLWGDLIDKIKSTHNASQEEIIKIIENFWEYFNINPEDKVKIIDSLPYKTEHLLKKG